MKVFSRAKWEKVSQTCELSKKILAMKGIPEERKWWNMCDGKTIEECEKMGFLMSDSWCIEKGEEMKIRDFIEKKIAIAFTSPEQIKEFARMCEGHDLKMCGIDVDAAKWLLDSPNHLFINPRMGIAKVVHLAYNFRERGMEGLSWSGNDTIDDGHYTDVGWKIVTFDEFKGNKTSTKHQIIKYQIIIECDGKKITTAKMIVNGKTTKEVEAKRNPSDEFSFRKGAELAFNRLFEKKQKKEVQRIAKVGDTIKIVNAIIAHGLYKNGDVFKVSFSNNVAAGIKMKNDDKKMFFNKMPDTVTICHDEYVVLE